MAAARARIVNKKSGSLVAVAALAAGLLVAAAPAAHGGNSG